MSTISRRVMPEKILVQSQAANTATFTAATNDTITSAGHGLSNNDVITMTNAGGALPAGLATDTYYYVISATTNTFSVSTTKGGTAVDITGTGTGTHTYIKEVFTEPILVADFMFTSLGVNTSGTTTATIFCRVAIADNDTIPAFAQAASETNRHYPQALIDTEDISNEQGDTGIVISATDINDLFQVNIDGKTYVQYRTQNFTAGSITLSTKSFG